MAREEEMLKERLKKLAELKKLKINPYPYSFDKKDEAAEIQKKHSKLKPEEKTKDEVSVAGRLIAIRLMGKINFAHLQDETGKIQIVIQEDVIGKKETDFFSKYIDSGDIVGVKGTVFRTKRGELSVLAEKIELLSKSLLPLPEKWHGLQDKEERYRLRYLDLIASPEIKELFKTRSEIVKALRDFLLSKGFMEVDTPVLQSLYGGAKAKPFMTHYNVYHTDVYLRIAPELYLKRLLVGGFEKVFEFARCFRNEGANWDHNPEFTNLEFYQAYIDYNQLMKIVEDMIIEAAVKANGKAEIERDGKKIAFKKPFKRVTFKEITKGKMTDEAFKGVIKEIIEPTFVIDYPVEISPLAKKKDEKTVQRFQLIVAGIEVANAFSELNDPIDQEKRFLEQEKMKDEEKHRYDKEFITSLEYGMPPAGGCGIGVERLVMLLTNSSSIREILFFPFMKPNNEEGEKKEKILKKEEERLEKREKKHKKK